MEEKQSVRVTNQTGIGWMFWSAGFLFSLGIGALDEFFIEGVSAWTGFWNGIICYLAWPVILGIYFR